MVTNQDMTQWMDTTDEWIVERTGIEQRHWVDPGEGRAPRLRPRRAGRRWPGRASSREDINMLIYATLSPDHMFPGAGVFAQRELGLKECAVLDIRQQYTGFIYGVSIADNFIRAGMYKNILVVGSEIHSTGLDVSTNGRDVAVLFGDGAGAVVIGPSEDRAPDLVDPPSRRRHRAEILWVEKPGSRTTRGLAQEDLDAGSSSRR